MKILLQDSRTAEFLCPTGRTKIASEAYDFRSTLAALQFAQKEQRQGIRILMKFDRSEFDLSLPVEVEVRPSDVPPLQQP